MLLLDHDGGRSKPGEMSLVSVSRLFTYVARVAAHPVFRPMAERSAALEHALYRHLAAGHALSQKQKTELGERYGLPGRYYNGVLTTLQGKIDGVTEKRKADVFTLTERLTQLDALLGRLDADRAKLILARDAIIARQDTARSSKSQSTGDDPLGLATMGLAEAPPETVLPLSAKDLAQLAGLRKRIKKLDHTIHQKKRKRGILDWKRTKAQADLERAAPSICFGSRTLFNAQFHRSENGYKDHAAWKRDWQAARASQFLIPGSHDEVSGNKTCKARVEDDGSITLKLRVPPFLTERFGDTATVSGLRFSYGHDAVCAAIRYASEGRPGDAAWQRETARAVKAYRAENAHRTAEELDVWEKGYRAERVAEAKRLRGLAKAALTWRFRHDGTSWTVAVTVTRVFELQIEDFAQGAIGVDLNVGFVSVMPVDHSGNPLKNLSLDIPMETVGLSSDKAMATIGEAVKKIIDLAVEQRRPVVIEKLDLQKKYTALKELYGPKLARRLSSFAYKMFAEMLASRCARFGVRLVEVNPAYTSHMGRCKYMRPLGVSVHRTAAIMIARRGMGMSEGLSASREVPLGDGGHVTLDPPARMGRRHVWSSWGRHYGRYKAALKARSSAKAQLARVGVDEGAIPGPRAMREGRRPDRPRGRPVEVRSAAPTPARGTA